MYRVIKTINGRRYFYDQTTWREAGKVKTRSIYVGPVDGYASRAAPGPRATDTALIDRLFDPAVADCADPVADSEELLKNGPSRQHRSDDQCD